MEDELLIQMFMAEADIVSTPREWISKSKLLKVLMANPQRIKDAFPRSRLVEPKEDVPEELRALMTQRRHGAVEKTFMHQCWAIAYMLCQPVTKYNSRKVIADEIVRLLAQEDEKTMTGNIYGGEHAHSTVLKKWLNGVEPHGQPSPDKVEEVIAFLADKKKIAKPPKGEWLTYPPATAIHQDDAKELAKLAKLLTEGMKQVPNLEYWSGKKLTAEGRQPTLKIRFG